MTDLRAKAQECLDEAAECHTDEVREVLLRISTVFEQLADEAERSEAETREAVWSTPFWHSDIAEPTLEQVRHT